MAQSNDRFILLPNNINLSREGLHYKDLLTYITIRSFNNHKTDRCTPCLNRIAGVSGLTKKFVIASIKRLEAAGYLEVKRSDTRHVSNRYYFKSCHSFSQIPYSIFDAVDLSTNEKAMLIALRQFVNGYDRVFLIKTINPACEMFGLSYKVVYTQYTGLIDKGYIVKYKKVYGNSFTVDRVKLSDKLNWAYHQFEMDKPKTKYDDQLDTLELR